MDASPPTTVRPPEGPDASLAETPIPHGPFLVEPDGALHPLRPPALRFAWRGRPCEARVEAGRLTLSAAAGAVPYTAEQPARRPAALAALAELPGELPPPWRLRVLPDHRLVLQSEQALATPTTATALVAAMVGFALALDVYLDRLDSAGLAAAGAAAGTVKTWPG
jgi:hypothetical protein